MRGKGWEERGPKKHSKNSDFWGAANRGLRDGGLRKSEDIRGTRPFSSDILWIFQMLFRSSGKGRRKGREKGRKRPISADFREGRPDTP